MSELVFFLEEQSAVEMLKGLLPRLLPRGMGFRCIPFEGKQDMEKQLVGRMAGYNVPEAKFVVLRDQDSGDCAHIKKCLVDLCKQSGKTATIVRIICRELESWYLADLQAVEQGLGLKNISRLQNQNPYRNPDMLPNPAQILK